MDEPTQNSPDPQTNAVVPSSDNNAQAQAADNVDNDDLDQDLDNIDQDQAEAPKKKSKTIEPGLIRKRDMAQFGFKFKFGGCHLRRTMMLEELTFLLDAVKDPLARHNEYRQAALERNCMRKLSSSNAFRSFQHLASLYVLNPSATIFRALRYFWSRDVAGRPQVAVLCAYVRDPILRSTGNYVVYLPIGSQVIRETLKDSLGSSLANRFSFQNREDIAYHAISTWTKAGLITSQDGQKLRSQPNTTPGGITYALFLGYLLGLRGQDLFESEYVKILSPSFKHTIQLANQAASRGWLVLNKEGQTLEVDFPELLNEEERKMINAWLGKGQYNALKHPV